MRSMAEDSVSFDVAADRSKQQSRDLGTKPHRHVLVVAGDRRAESARDELVRKAGYDVAAVVERGDLAIALTQLLRFDLVLMDVTLQGELDGVETGALVREYSLVPILYVTARTDPELLARAELTQPCGFVVEPFSVEQMRAAVEMALALGDCSPAPASASPSALRVLTDGEGSVTLGWAADRVLYARLTGVLSAELGAAYVAELQRLLGDARGVHYFADLSELRTYDVQVRIDFTKFTLARRPQFASFVFLAWGGGVQPAAERFAKTVGPGVRFLTDSMEFHSALLELAPRARRTVLRNDDG